MASMYDELDEKLLNQEKIKSLTEQIKINTSGGDSQKNNCSVTIDVRQKKAKRYRKSD